MWSYGFGIRNSIPGCGSKQMLERPEECVVSQTNIESKDCFNSEAGWFSPRYFNRKAHYSWDNFPFCWGALQLQDVQATDPSPLLCGVQWGVGATYLLQNVKIKVRNFVGWLRFSHSQKKIPQTGQTGGLKTPWRQLAFLLIKKPASELSNKTLLTIVSSHARRQEPDLPAQREHFGSGALAFDSKWFYCMFPKPCSVCPVQYTA